MKKILIPIDFSAPSKHAIDVAINLGIETHATLVLFHSSLPSEGMNNSVHAAIYVHEYHEIKRKNLLDIADTIKANDYPGEVIIDHQIDFATTAILAAAKNHGVDMIVMGATGSSGLAGMILGSTASGVLAKSECPLLVVPADFMVTSLNGHILLGLDYTTVMDAASVAVLQFFKKHFNYRVIAVHIANHVVDEGVKQQYIESNLPGIVDGTISVEGEKVSEALISIKDEYTLPILCTITKQRNWFESLFSGSVSKTLAHHSDVPLLCLHETN